MLGTNRSNGYKQLKSLLGRRTGLNCLGPSGRGRLTQKEVLQKMSEKVGTSPGRGNGKQQSEADMDIEWFAVFRSVFSEMFRL